MFRSPFDGLPPDVDISRLTPRDRRRLLQLCRHAYGGQSLNDFILADDPKEPPPPHLRILVDVFEQARRSRIRALLSMPPRAGKSKTIRRALAWWSKQRPADLNCYASYNTDLAEDQSRDVRAIAMRAGVAMSSDHNQAANWRTERGGGLFAAGLSAGITGRGVTGIAVVDDPYPNAAAARSPAVNNEVKTNFNSVIRTRMEGWSSIIVVHTRWVPDDLIGTLAEEGGWDVINIPAIAVDGVKDPLGRKPGESFWPDRPQFTPEALAEIKRVDEFTFGSLYQGQPVPDGARMFYGEPRYWDPKKTDLTGCVVVIGADPAATKKNTSDHHSAVALAIKPPFTCPTVYVLDAMHRRMTVPEGTRALRQFQLDNWNAPLKVEAVGGFKGVPQTLRELVSDLRVDEVTPIGDKVLRAQLFASAWNDGRWLLPLSDYRLTNSTAQPSWVPGYIKEVREFTGQEGRPDDQVDASAHGYNSVVKPAHGKKVNRGSVEDASAYG